MYAYVHIYICTYIHHKSKHWRGVILAEFKHIRIVVPLPVPQCVCLLLFMFATSLWTRNRYLATVHMYFLWQLLCGSVTPPYLALCLQPRVHAQVKTWMDRFPVRLQVEESPESGKEVFPPTWAEVSALCDITCVMRCGFFLQTLNKVSLWAHKWRNFNTNFF